MHILILNWRDPKNPKSGGAEIVTMEHAKAWVKNGYQVTWFTSKFPGSSSVEKISGVKLVRRGNWLTVYVLAVWYYFREGKQFDLVIDEIHGLPFFTPLYVKKTKIAFIHEVATDIWDYMYPFPLNKVGRTMESLYLRLYRNIPFWTDAQSTVEDLEQHGILKENCTVIACPATSQSVKTLPRKEKNLTLIFVSRLVKMKGIEEVVKSFSLILQQVDKAKLWIVGWGEDKYLKRLKQTIAGYKIDDKITFWGALTEEKKLELMRRSHLLLHASVKEGWGLVVIESASQATPSVVYNVAGLRDSVKNGKTGIVLSENTPYEMARAVLLLIRNKKRYKAIQKNSLDWAKSLTWEKVTKQSIKLIGSV